FATGVPDGRVRNSGFAARYPESSKRLDCIVKFLQFLTFALPFRASYGTLSQRTFEITYTSEIANCCDDQPGATVIEPANGLPEVDLLVVIKERGREFDQRSLPRREGAVAKHLVEMYFALC